jgi:hypothetical protein
MNQNEEKSFVCPDFLIVRELSLDCILDGISTCLELGIERFGILQKDAHQPYEFGFCHHFDELSQAQNLSPDFVGTKEQCDV